jgi:ubiquinone/menaquinone biosynthesis C-methylase UbiE
MYKQLAKYYDIIYSWKDYAMEAEKVYQLIDDLKKSGGNELLDAACGTGEHDKYLMDYYTVTGVDLNEKMLEIARKKNKKIKYIKGDMRSINLHKQFDAVVCLFSAIGHLLTYENLEKAIANFSRHLKKGGVLVIEPFVSPKAFTTGVPHSLYINEPDLKLVRMNVSRRKNGIAYLDFHFLVGDKSGIKYYLDKQKLALFDEKKFLQIMNNNGFKSKFTKNGLMRDRGLFIGIKK